MELLLLVSLRPSVYDWLPRPPALDPRVSLMPLAEAAPSSSSLSSSVVE